MCQFGEAGTVPVARTPQDGSFPGKPSLADCEVELATLAAAAGGHDGARRLIRTEVFRALDREQIGQAGARTIDAALDGADGAIADRCGLLVRKAGGADEDQRLALIGRKLR